MIEKDRVDSGTVAGALHQVEEADTKIRMISAIQKALVRAMTDDDRVVILGEDIAENEGVFRATEELLKNFGKKRVLTTPLSETALAGITIGMAAAGLIPVVEIQFLGFAYSTLDQLINHASRLRNRTRGRLSCPMVLRAPYGCGIAAPEHHSESTEALFAHIPGLRVVIPSSPPKAYGLLLASIRNPDPVVFLEPTRAYRSFVETVVDNGEALPLDSSFLEREGTHVTLVSWGAMLKEVREAADKLAKQGIEAEIIDVATLGATFDIDTILASVQKTGRCIIVHEAPLTGGFGAEIAARIACEGLTSLLAPIVRVTGWDTIVPLPQLEHCYLPTVERILNAVHEVMKFK